MSNDLFQLVIIQMSDKINFCSIAFPFLTDSDHQWYEQIIDCSCNVKSQLATMTSMPQEAGSHQVNETFHDLSTVMVIGLTPHFLTCFIVKVISVFPVQQISFSYHHYLCTCYWYYIHDIWRFCLSIFTSTNFSLKPLCHNWTNHIPF